MLDQYLKKFKDDIMVLFLKNFPDWVTPNQITIVAFFFGFLSALLMIIGMTTLSFYCWILNRILDGFDGLLARERRLTSDFGGYLDLVLDCVVYSIIPLSICIQREDKTLSYIGIYMVGSYFVNMTAMMYCTALQSQKKYVRRYFNQKEQLQNTQRNAIYLFVGLIEGTETMIMYTLFFLFPEILVYLFVIFSLGVSIMIVQRVQYARSVLTQ